MRTYLFDKLSKIKQFNDKLDELTEVKRRLCNKPWLVFNEGNEREIYKFREDGSIVISINGSVTKGTWEFDSTDKTIIITTSSHSIMVHPGIIEDSILGLQVDGTNQCAFLIDELSANDLLLKTYSDFLFWLNQRETSLFERKKQEERESRYNEEVNKRKERWIAFIENKAKANYNNEEYVRMRKRTEGKGRWIIILIVIDMLYFFSIPFLDSNYQHVYNFLFAILLIITIMLAIILTFHEDEGKHEYIVKDLKEKYPFESFKG